MGFSKLEQMLSEQYRGTLQEPGSFTLDRDKALEKIADFALSGELDWILKLGQAATVAGSESFRVTQTRDDLVFRFRVSGSRADFDSVFFSPGTSVDEFWANLRLSLWSVGVGQKRPFHFLFASKAYFWDGEKLHYPDEADPDPEYLELTVSHRTVDQGKGLPLIRIAQAARRNSVVLELLKKRFFSMPLRVFSDAVPLEGFQRAPGLGYSPHDHPLVLSWLPGEPGLGIPPSTRQGTIEYVGDEKLRKLSQNFDPRPPEQACLAALLLSAHAYYSDGGDSGSWVTSTAPSQVYWIRQGVVARIDSLAFKESTVSAAFLINADDLRTDISGLGINEDDCQKRLREVFLSLVPRLLATEPDLTLVDRDLHQKKMYFAGGSALLGLGLKVVFPPATLLVAAGVVSGLILSSGLASVDSGLDKGLKQLRAGFQKQLADYGYEMNIDDSSPQAKGD